MTLHFSAFVTGISPTGNPILNDVSCENGMRRDHVWLPREYGPGFTRMVGMRVSIFGHCHRYLEGEKWDIRNIERVVVVE